MHSDQSSLREEMAGLRFKNSDLKQQLGESADIISNLKLKESELSNQIAAKDMKHEYMQKMIDEGKSQDKFTTDQMQVMQQKTQ